VDSEQAALRAAVRPCLGMTTKRWDSWFIHNALGAPPRPYGQRRRNSNAGNTAPALEQKNVAPYAVQFAKALAPPHFTKATLLHQRHAREILREDSSLKSPYAVLLRQVDAGLQCIEEKVCHSYTVAGAACFPLRAIAATMLPNNEPTAPVQPIHNIICGRTPAKKNFCSTGAWARLGGMAS
jgi:hypothetical protein